MSATRSTMFEVRVEANGDGKISTYHFDKRHPEQSIEAAKRYGKVRGVHKVKYTDVFGDIEHLQLNQAPLSENPYESALHMDEFIWKKRNNRIKNSVKDRKTY